MIPERLSLNKYDHHYDPTEHQSSIHKNEQPEAEAAHVQQVISQVADSERVKKAQEHAARILEKQPEVLTNIKQFAFLHCGAYLKDTGNEGGSLRDTLPYWKGLLEKWDHNQAKIASPAMNSDQIHHLSQAFQDLEEFDHLITSDHASPETLQQLVKKKLNERNECYFPTGWRGSPGHFMVCKFRLEKDQVIMELMTKGGGAEFHPILSVGKNRDRHDYRFYPVEISTNVLFQEQIGKPFFSCLLKLEKLPEGFVRDLGPEDLYGLLLLLGKARPRTAEDLAAHSLGVTAQRSGTCVETGLHMLLYESSPKDAKRNLYAVKFQSLVDGFRQFKNDFQDDPEAAFYLHLAAKEHLVRSLKLYPELISDDEFLLGYAVSTEIETRTREILEAVESKRTRNAPPLTSPSGTSLKTSLGSVSYELERIWDHLGDEWSFESLIANLPSVETGLDVVPMLEKLVGEIERLIAKRSPSCSDHSDLFAQIRAAVEQLPMPSGDLTDPFWDAVPEEQIPKCLSLLRQIVLAAERNCKTIIENSGARYDCWSLQGIALRAYDIAAQIAPRLNELKIREYAFTSPEPPKYILNPSTAVLIDQTTEHFQKRAARCPKGNLFPLRIEIEKLNSTPHGSYLLQFLDPVKKSQLSAMTSNWEAAALQDNDRKLYPAPFYDLQALAYLSHFRTYLQVHEESPHMSKSQILQWTALYRYKKQDFMEAYDLHVKDFSESIPHAIANSAYGRQLFHTKPLPPQNLNPLLSWLAKHFDIKHDSEVYFENGTFCTFSSVMTHLASINPNENPPLPAHIMEEFLLFKTHSELQAGEALNWAGEHLHLLSEPFVQSFLEIIIYNQGSLIENLRYAQAPTIERIQSFLLEGFNLYVEKPEQLSTILWLTRMGISLEGFIKRCHGNIKGRDFPDYYAILQNLLDKTADPEKRSLIFQHMLLTFANLTPQELTEDDIKKLLAARFFVEMISWKTEISCPTLRGDSLCAYFQHHKAVKDHLCGLDKPARSRFLNSFLKTVAFQEVDLEWSVKGDSYIAESRNPDYTYEVHLDGFTLLIDGQPVQSMDKQIVERWEYKQVFGEKPLRSILKDGMHYIMPDEAYRIEKTTSAFGRLNIQRKILLDGKDVWYVFVPSIPLHETLTKNQELAAQFPRALRGEDRFCWVEAGALNPDLVVTERTSGKILYRYNKDSGLREIDPASGKYTGRTVLNLIRPEEGTLEKAWAEFLGDLDEVENILVLQKLDTDKKPFIDRIAFPMLGGLSFSAIDIGGEKRLQWDQDPAFYLASTQDIAELHRFKGALLLEDSSRKVRKVLLPAAKFRSTSEFPQSYIRLDPKEKLHTGGKPYFTYDWPPGEERLQPESPRAALYLAMLLRAQRDYEKALQYLKMSYKYDNDDLADLSIVQKCLSAGKFPDACAFDCQLALRMREHRTKHTKQKFREGRTEELTKLDKELDQHFYKQYEGYRERMSDFKEGIGAIPHPLRLTDHQEHYFFRAAEEQKEVPCFELGPVSPLSKMEEGLVYDSGQLPDMPDGEVRFGRAFLGKVDQDSKAGAAGAAAREAILSDMAISGRFLELCGKALNGSAEERQILKMNLYYFSRTPRELSEKQKALLQVLLSILQYPRMYSKIHPMGGRPDPAICRETAAQIFKVFNDNFTGKRAKEIDYKLQALPKRQPPKNKAVKPDTALASYPKAPIAPFKASIEEALTEAVRHPLKEASKDFTIKKRNLPLVGSAFPLENVDPAREIPLVQRQLADLKKGHAINAAKSKIHYRTEGSIDRLEASLREQANIDTARAAQLTVELEKLANTTLGQRQEISSREGLRLHLDHRAKQKAAQVPRLTLDLLIYHLMRRDAAGLLRLNPALKVQDGESINSKLLELFVVAARAKQGTEALETLGKIKSAAHAAEKEALEQQLAAILDRERAYDPSLRPEFLIYEFASGMMLRKDQVDLLEWIFSNFENPKVKNILFQFAAGGGKTKVLMPILSAYIAGKGYLPVGLNISSLYEIGKGDLDKSLMRAFKQSLEVLEIELDTNVRLEDWKKIYADLQAFCEQKKCLALKTETWHALKLKDQLALDAKRPEESEILFSILEFFRTKGVSLIDEGHQSLDPLHESNIASGQPTLIPTMENKVITTMMQMLAGQRGDIRVDGKPIAQIVRLLENKQAMLTDQELLKARKAIIEALIRDPLLEDVRSHAETIKAAGSPGLQAVARLLSDYFNAPPGEKPAWLANIRKGAAQKEKEMAGMLVLAKKFLYETCPHTLRLIQAIHYGDSLHPGDLTAAPRHHKQPVTSKFQDIYVTLALTVQNTIQTGLDGEKLAHLLRPLLKEHNIQKKALHDQRQSTNAQLLFDQWWGGADEPPFLDHIFLDNKGQMENIAARIGKNPAVVEQYLLKCALPQIKVFHEKMTSTPPELLEGFYKNIAFSATPGLLELYPVELLNLGAEKPKPGEQPPGVRLDLGFEPQVLEMLCRPHNKQITAVSFETLEQFFNEVDKQAPGLISNLCCIIDQGGIFRAFDNPSMIEGLLAYAKSKGIPFTGGLYRRETGGLLQTETGQLMFKIAGEGSQDIPLKGSDLREAMKLIGLNYDKMLLATFFDRAITTGADILQPLNGRGLLTVGEGGTKTYTLQAAMRLRKLLLGADGQSVHWIIENELLKQIPRQSAGQLTVEEIFLWMIRNESVLMEKAIVMRAFQGIQHILRRAVWRTINASGGNPQERIELYHRFREGLVDRLAVEPYETFGRKMTLEDAEIVLNAYADRCANNLGLKKNYRSELPQLEKEALELLISQTKELVGKIDQASAEMAQEMHQQQESRQEVRQEQRALQEADQFIRPYTTYQEDYSDSYHNILDKNFLTPDFLKKGKNQHLLLRDVLELKFVPKDIIVSDPFLHVRNEVQKELRPVKYILAVSDKGKTQYLLCSRRGAQHYREQIKKGGAAVPGRKVMLLDGDGKIVINGPGEMGFNEDDARKLLGSEDFRDRLVMIQFLNGAVKDLSRLKRLAREKWTSEEYNKALKLIPALHVGLTPIDQESLEAVNKFRHLKAAPEGLSENLSTMGLIIRVVRYFFPVKRV